MQIHGDIETITHWNPEDPRVSLVVRVDPAMAPDDLGLEPTVVARGSATDEIVGWGRVTVHVHGPSDPGLELGGDLIDYMASFT